MLRHITPVAVAVALVAGSCGQPSGRLAPETRPSVPPPTETIASFAVEVTLAVRVGVMGAWIEARGDPVGGTIRRVGSDGLAELTQTLWGEAVGDAIGSGWSDQLAEAARPHDPTPDDADDGDDRAPQGVAALERILSAAEADALVGDIDEALMKGTTATADLGEGLREALDAADALARAIIDTARKQFITVFEPIGRDTASRQQAIAGVLFDIAAVAIVAPGDLAIVDSRPWVDALSATPESVEALARAVAGLGDATPLAVSALLVSADEGQRSPPEGIADDLDTLAGAVDGARGIDVSGVLAVTRAIAPVVLAATAKAG